MKDRNGMGVSCRKGELPSCQSLDKFTKSQITRLFRTECHVLSINGNLSMINIR